MTAFQRDRNILLTKRIYYSRSVYTKCCVHTIEYTRKFDHHVHCGLLDLRRARPRETSIVLEMTCFLQDSDVLRDYIAYARTFINPRLSDEAGQKLIQTYVRK